MRAGFSETRVGAVIDQSVECIRQSAVVEPGAGGRLQILERHTGCPVLGIKGGQDLQYGDTLQCVWAWSPGSHPASWLAHILMDHVRTGTANRQPLRWSVTALRGIRVQDMAAQDWHFAQGGSHQCP